MLRFWKTNLYILCTCCFCSSVKADDLDLVSRTYLSNKKYAKNIEVRSYLVTKDQVAKLFRGESAEVVQKTNKELYDKEVFLLVRTKNKGDVMSFGLLNCKIPNRGIPITIDIEMMPSSMQTFHDSALCIGEGLIPNNDDVPIVSCEWKSLYTM